MGNNRDAIWLVKSDLVIQGPFTQARIAEGLKTREFRTIDEILSPGGRWHYIREEPVFLRAVEEARMGTIGPDDTTRDTMTNTVSQTINLTDTNIPDDRTEEISATLIQEAMFQSYDDVNRGGRDRRKDNPALQNQYTYDADPEVKSAATLSTRWVVMGTLVLIFLTAGYVVFNRFVARPIQTQSQMDEDMTVAFESLDLGDYQTALEKFRIVNEANPDDRGLHTQLALLEIQIGQQSVVGRRLLESLMYWAGAEKKLISVGLGLAALREADYPAATTHFQETLGADPLFVQAEVNLGVTAMYIKDFNGASNFFQLAIKDGGADGIEVMLLSQALVEIADTQNDRSFLIEARKYIDQTITKEGPYNDHLLIAGAYMSYKMSENDKAENYLKLFGDRPVSGGEKFRLDLNIHRDLVSWVNLNQWCLQVIRELDPKAWLIAIESKCLALSGDLMGASARIEQAVEQDPRDPLVQAVYADLLLKMNSADRAKVAVEKALDFDKASIWKLPQYLQAEVCNNLKDQICAIKYWKTLLQRDSESLAALSGLANSYFSEGNYEESKRYLAMARRIQSNYIPALRLQKGIARIEQKRGL